MSLTFDQAKNALKNLISSDAYSTMSAQEKYNQIIKIANTASIEATGSSLSRSPIGRALE
jgi:hypothetical protein